jgi:parvulin-like peptidyl-prolyl isomerase
LYESVGRLWWPPVPCVNPLIEVSAVRNVPLRMSALAAAVMLLMTACSDGDGGSEGEQAASVNGETITVQQVQDRYQAMTQGSQLSQQVYDNPAMQDQLKAQILSQLIQVQLLRQGADELGVEVGDAEIDEQRYRIEQRLSGQGTSLQDEMERQGMSEEDLRQELEALALQDAVAAELASGDDITDEEVRSYFEENTAQFHTAQVRLLTTGSEEDAQQALQRLQDGDDFATVSEELGSGRSTTEAQELTKASLEQSTPELASAVFEEAEVGGFAGPVQAQQQWYVVEVQQRTEPELSEVEGQIREQLSNQQQSTQLDQWLTEQAQQADITVAERYGTWDPYTRKVTPDTAPQGSGSAGSGSGSGGSGSGSGGSGGSGSGQ